MKITIEHLAPYLPYSLRLIVPEIHDKFECRLVISNNTVSMRGGLNISEAISHNAKPILYPLSDLTKPITVEGYSDGKEFVPMTHLFMLSDGIYPFDKQPEFKVMSRGSIMIEQGPYTSILFSTSYGYGDERIENTISFYAIVYTHAGRTYITPDKNEPILSALERFGKHETKVPANQLLLSKMLYRWHFDVNGLIEKGLAIDINTIQP